MYIIYNIIILYIILYYTYIIYTCMYIYLSIYLYKIESLCYIPESITILQINCISVNI